jgi:hypothetical protein
MLALTGSPFWQEESYNHLVRHLPEFVRVGLVVEASDYPWSNAGWSPADHGVRPTGRNL